MLLMQSVDWLNMYKVRSDFLKECMSDVGQAPIDVFQKSFCFVCGNRECSRSSANNLQFDRRVNNWKKDLFDEVPRASDMDPKFAQIRAKQFFPAGQSPTVVFAARVQENIDVPLIKTTAGASTVETKPVVDTPVDLEPIEPTPLASVEPTTIEPIKPPQLIQPAPTQGQANTPFSQGMTLPGFQEEKPSDIIIDPGGTFKF